jgi:N-carbamoylputrescine amidase
MQDIRIATISCNAGVGKIRQNLDKTASFAKAARNNRADIICFPELNITGYTNHRDIVDIAQTIPGPASEEIRDMAASSGLLILAGMAEKGDDGRIYASHLVAGPKGNLEIYRKLHIAPPERAYYSPGKNFALYHFQDTCFGIQLCYDAHFPELSTHMALHGAEIVFMPHASPRGSAGEKHASWMRHLTARAYDNSVFIVACNQAGSNGKGLVFAGNAVVIGPTGKVIAKNLNGRENIMFTDLKAADLHQVRNNPMHFFLPNRRPELYGRKSPLSDIESVEKTKDKRHV